MQVLRNGTDISGMAGIASPKAHASCSFLERVCWKGLSQEWSLFIPAHTFIKNTGQEEKGSAQEINDNALLLLLCFPFTYLFSN